jgi:hypothetical protein
MSVQVKESVWNTVRLGSKSNGGYAMSSHAVSSSWYNNYIDNSGSRFNRLQRYDDADTTSVEISRALDVLAEDISSSNADDDYVFLDVYPDETKTKKTLMRFISEAIRTWGARTRMDVDLFERVRKTLKYGATFYRKQPDGSCKELKTERMIGYILSNEDDQVVTHYLYNKEGRLIKSSGTLSQQERQRMNAVSVNDIEIIPVSDLIVLKTNNEPFGMSIIEPVYRTWRQMSLIEDAVIIYRVVRAPERRVYYIDTGNLQGPKREAAIEKQRMRLMQKNAVKNKELTTEYDPHSTSEDIFIPTNSTGKGSRIETLPGGQNLGETADLEWFSRKLAAGLRIPHSMIDTQGDQERSQYNDMRVGQLYQIEMRYMGYVKRFQRRFAATLFENFKEFCIDRDIVIPEDLELRINEPMSFSQYKEMELNQTQLNVYNSTLQINVLSKKFSLQKYLGLTQDELHHNEEERLRELGISDDVIKGMEQTEIDNIVYGTPTPAVAEKYGLQAQEQNQQGW